jgi:AcrR family transcriptional regulator
MVVAAAESLRRHGIAGTSFTEVLAQSGAARGAIYHHFPDGKNQLVHDALELTGDGVGQALARLPAGRSEAEVVDGFLGLVRPVVQESAAGAGCAVAAVVTECAPADELMATASSILTAWTAQLRSHLEAAGATPGRASELATLMLTTLEGAHVLCRAAGEMAPFDRAAAALRAAAVS